jgi:uncharacterized membrane protein YgaE (UPF0421/DUF939 family)
MPRDALDLWVHRGRMSAKERFVRWRSKRWALAQCAISAGVAWFLAHDVLGHPAPVFASIAAVVSLGGSPR